jgi:hypothetical protein
VTSEYQRAERTFHLQLNAPPAEVFPLFGPKLEMRWAPEWQPRFIHPPDGEVDRHGAVFIVPPDDERPESTWIMTAYEESEGRVEYVYVAPQHNVTQIWIRIAAAAGAKSDVAVTYRRTALSAAGNVFVERFVATVDEMREHWERSINGYLARSQRLR